MLRVVAGVLRRRVIQGWLVGGSVRDLELGRESPDLDIVVSGDAAAVAKEVAAALHSPWFALSERHLTYRVMGREGHVDVAAARGGGILDDLAERDFTINAMALPIDGGHAAAEPVDREARIDPFGGLGHLHEKRLVAVSARIFADDPLRLMRAARFCHLLGLELDPCLRESIRRQARDLPRAAAERVTAEMILTLAGGRSAGAVRLWQELGLLEVVLPEVSARDAVARDAVAPVLALLERLDDVLERLMVWFPATTDAVEARLADQVDGVVVRPVALRLAGLTHRLGEGEGVVVGRRLRMSGEMISLLRTVSRCFSRGLDGDTRLEGEAPALPESRTLTRPEVLFLWEAAPFEPEVILLAAAAGEASVLPGPAGRMMALWAERSVCGIPRPPVNGDVLMNELGLEGGPLLGRVLREVRLAWETGEAKTTDEVLAIAAGKLESGRRPE